MAKTKPQGPFTLNIPAAVAVSFNLVELDGATLEAVNKRGRGHVHVLTFAARQAAQAALDVVTAKGSTMKAPFKAIRAARERLTAALG